MKIGEILIILVSIIISSLLHSDTAINEDSLIIIRTKNTVEIINKNNNNEIVRIFDYQENSNLLVSQAKLVFPHLCILLKDTENNYFLAETYFLTNDLRILKKRDFGELTFSEDICDFGFVNNEIDKIQLNCKFELSSTKLSFCLWDSKNCSYVHPFNYRYYEDTSFEDNWWGYPDSYRDKKIEITENRIIFGFQQSAVELIKQNNYWILSQIFAPEVPYCEFSREITFTDSLLIVCLGTCCVENESLVLIYELANGKWSNPSILGLYNIDEDIHYLANFILYKEEILTIAYKPHEKYKPEIIKKYKKSNDSWLLLNS